MAAKKWLGLHRATRALPDVDRLQPLWRVLSPDGAHLAVYATEPARLFVHLNMGTVESEMPLHEFKGWYTSSSYCNELAFAPVSTICDHVLLALWVNNNASVEVVDVCCDEGYAQLDASSAIQEFGQWERPTARVAWSPAGTHLMCWDEERGGGCIFSTVFDHNLAALVSRYHRAPFHTWSKSDVPPHSGLAWAPNGTMVVVAWVTQEPIYHSIKMEQVHVSVWKIASVNCKSGVPVCSDGNTTKQITNVTLKGRLACSGAVRNVCAAVWSPDGSQVAISFDGPGGIAVVDLRKVKGDGNKVVQGDDSVSEFGFGTTPVPLKELRWRADGTLIGFTPFSTALAIGNFGKGRNAGDHDWNVVPNNIVVSDISGDGWTAFGANIGSQWDKDAGEHIYTLRPWSDRSHRLFGREFKELVFLLMCIKAKLVRVRSGFNSTRVPPLPMEMWLEVFAALGAIW